MFTCPWERTEGWGNGREFRVGVGVNGQVVVWGVHLCMRECPRLGVTAFWGTTTVSGVMPSCLHIRRQALEIAASTTVARISRRASLTTPARASSSRRRPQEKELEVGEWPAVSLDPVVQAPAPAPVVVPAAAAASAPPVQTPAPAAGGGGGGAAASGVAASKVEPAARFENVVLTDA